MLTAAPDPDGPKSRNLKALEDCVATVILLSGHQVTGRNNYLNLSNLTSLLPSIFAVNICRLLFIGKHVRVPSLETAGQVNIFS